ncbi:MAG: response regulator [Chloroflexi bacterium]|nr:response regulator [Chloroflexota bacterium]
MREPAPSRPCRVVVADGDPNVRAALRLLLARDPALRVVGSHHQLAELLEAVAAAQPDLILLDWELPDLHAAANLAHLRSLCPTAAIIALSTRDEQRARALELGAAGFVGKREPPAQLLAMLRAAAASRESAKGAPPPIVSP